MDVVDVIKDCKVLTLGPFRLNVEGPVRHIVESIWQMQSNLVHGVQTSLQVHVFNPKEVFV